MVYTNFDSRVKGNYRIPEERIRLLREMERKLQLERELRRLARLGKRD